MSKEWPLHTKELTIGHNKGKPKEVTLARDLELTGREGELIALVGPNGSGKSTLLHTLSGLLEPIEGSVLIDGASLQSLSAQERARRISVVLTAGGEGGDLDVKGLVGLGRSPYMGIMGKPSKEDREVVNRVIQETGISDKTDRKVTSLSDGERQKVLIARALAQDTPVMILDEPTAHLDLPNRVEIVRFLKELAHEKNKTILLSSHDLELVLKLADRAWLMSSKGTIQEGVPEELAIKGAYTEVFQGDGFRFDIQTGSFEFTDHPRGKIGLQGEGPSAFWTKRALERCGFEVVSPEETMERVIVKEDSWNLHKEVSGKEEKTFSSLGELIHWIDR